MICEWAEQTAAGAAPREFHPPAVCRALPIACDALNARTVAVREYLSFCVSSPMRRRAHFPVQYMKQEKHEIRCSEIEKRLGKYHFFEKSYKNTRTREE